MQTIPLIGRGNLTAGQLAGQAAVVTGAGRGIGYEAARALLWLGARVILAEVDRQTSREAEQRLRAEFGVAPDGQLRVVAVQSDVGDERSVQHLAREAERRIGPVDIVLNNATVTPMGAAHTVPIKAWDDSYRVNLRGPVLLARAFLPGMLARNRGVFVAVSSAGGAYMGAYEVLKTAQVDLARTLEAELEGTGVCAFTIGPGLVRTPGLAAAVPKLAALYGKTEEEFFAMSAAHEISVEAAGAGFAAAIALAERFRGMEIGARQALNAAGIPLEAEAAPAAPTSSAKRSEALALARTVRQTLAEQSAGWAERPLFERQWVARDFKRYAGQPAADWLRDLDRLVQALEQDGADGARWPASTVPISQLGAYYAHTQEVLAGWEKDAAKRDAHMKILKDWQIQAERLAELTGSR
jgi:NAD(P)-dependent dehydrogenase (short-subunit alcohol dehydrogenase family)